MCLCVCECKQQPNRTSCPEKNHILLILGWIQIQKEWKTKNSQPLTITSQYCITELLSNCTSNARKRLIINLRSLLSCGRIWITYFNVLDGFTIPDFSPSSFPALCWYLRMLASCLVLVSSIEAWGYTCRRKKFHNRWNKYDLILPTEPLSMKTVEVW